MDDSESEFQLFQMYLSRVARTSPVAELCEEVLPDREVLTTDDLSPVLHAGTALASGRLLWMWAKYELKRRDNKNALNEAKERTAMVVELVEEHHYSKRDAEDHVARTFAALAKRDKDHAATHWIVEALKVAKGILPGNALKQLPGGKGEDE